MDQFCTAQWQRVSREIRALRGAVSGPSVHRFRVAVKKVRAVLRAIDRTELMDALRPLYRSCGNVREPEILAEILRQISDETTVDVSPFLEELRRRRIAAARSVRRELGLVSDRTLTMLGSTIRGAVVDDHDPSLVRARERRIRKLRRRVLEQRGRLGSEDVLHNVRRDVKEMSYLLGAYTPIVADDERRRAITHETESFLGSVHDEDVLRAWLEQLQPPLGGTVDRDRLLHILDKRRRVNRRAARIMIDTIRDAW
jgi:CHAD domain-containing protein